jgi:hypothetical protein
MKTVIFSRNRAMQLDATLRSFFLHCQDPASASIQILYLATDAQNTNQYKELIATYSQVVFVQQNNFQQDLEAILNHSTKVSRQQRRITLVKTLDRIKFRTGSLAWRVWKHSLEPLQSQLIRMLIPPPPDDTYILFLVDDNIFVRDFSLGDAILVLQTTPDALGVSLRLGKNTTYCYAHDRAQKLPEFTPQPAGLLKYDWTTADNDFGYPLEVSSSIYRAKEIVPLVCGLNFRNPNDLEGYMAAHSRWFRNKFPSLLCCEKSITFCNPINIVQTTTENRAGKKVYYSIDELIERFNHGERINVEMYTGFTPNACHQEVELVFEKIEDS